MSDAEAQSTAEAEKLFKSLSATHRGKLGVCTRKMNDIKALLIADGDMDTVEQLMKDLIKCIDDFKAVHAAVQDLLDDEEKENDHVDWFEPRIMNFNYFMKDVESWKIQQHNLQATVDHKDSNSNSSRTSSKSSSSAKIAAAEKAALEARSKAIPTLQALRMEEAVLKSKMEQLEQKAQLDAADTKLKNAE